MKLQKRPENEHPHHGGPLSLREAMSRVFDESFWDPFEEKGLSLGERNIEAFPKVNISETEKEVKVTASIPGIDPEKINVEVQEDSVSISGALEEEKEDSNERHYRFERDYGEFYRSFTLPAKVDPGKVTAQSKNGVITIILPKTVDKALKKKVDVKKMA